MKKIVVGILVLFLGLGSIALAIYQKLHSNPSNKYGIAGFDNYKQVEDFAKKFKGAVLSGDKKQVSKMIKYPLLTNLKDGSNLKIKSSDEFIKRFDEVFYPEFLEAFKKAVPRDMFRNHQGVMLSSEENVFWIWFQPLDNTGQTIGVSTISSDMNMVANALKELAEK